jgi:hypothetical protein
MINDDVELRIADTKYNFQMMTSDWPMSIRWRNDHGRIVLTIAMEIDD